MSSDATRSPAPCLTVGALRKILDGASETAYVLIGTYDTGIEEWCEEPCLRLSISFTADGAERVVFEGTR